MNKKVLTNKRKIFNDPVYGFLSIDFDIIFDLIEHRYFQRLRRIKQLGLTELVYPGALHTRFHHALGSMHLMKLALHELQLKNIKISTEEKEAATIAILLHDIGHGPFSHALEKSIVNGITHEDLSLILMNKLNEEFNGKLSLAIKIFKNQYHKKFLHQLIASQLDVDRLDYLKRDSFYTGVSEGVINTDRIIKMLNVVDDKLVIEEKGIYSIEKFIIARRLMYWQVYLHKTVLSAEVLLLYILKRAKFLANKGEKLFASPALSYFLYNNIGMNEFLNDKKALENFILLDDNDIITSIKTWINSNDKILSDLCNRLINRHLFKIIIQNKKFEIKQLEKIKKNLKKILSLSDDEIKYYFFSNTISNNAYNPKYDKIFLLYKNKKLIDIAEAADQLNISALSKPVKKYYICFPKYL